MKVCIFERKTQIRDRKYTRCKLDGSIHRDCQKSLCPHFRPTFRFRKILRRILEG